MAAVEAPRPARLLTVPACEDAPSPAQALKARYGGEGGTGLALCHGDMHAGSVMVDPASGAVKVILCTRVCRSLVSAGPFA